jgi:hypothetical protein
LIERSKKGLVFSLNENQSPNQKTRDVELGYTFPLENKSKWGVTLSYKTDELNGNNNNNTFGVGGYYGKGPIRVFAKATKDSAIINLQYSF